MVPKSIPDVFLLKSPWWFQPLFFHDMYDFHIHSPFFAASERFSNQAKAAEQQSDLILAKEMRRVFCQWTPTGVGVQWIYHAH